MVYSGFNRAQYVSAGSNMHRYKAQNHLVPNGENVTEWNGDPVQSLHDVGGEFCGEFHMYRSFYTSCQGRHDREELC